MRAQLAASLPSKTRPSAPVQLDLTFQWERFCEIVDELVPLIAQYSEESGRRTVEPDFDRYFQYDAAGILYVWTARAGETLAGFAICLVTNDLLYATTKFAYAGPVYLARHYRKGMRGVRFINALESGLKRLGVQVLRASANLSPNDYTDGRRVEALYRRLGYQPVETALEKVL